MTKTGWTPATCAVRAGCMVSGTTTAAPIPGDYDADGRADFALYFPPGSFSGQTTGIHYAILAAGGSRSLYGLGIDGDVPLAKRP